MSKALDKPLNIKTPKALKDKLQTIARQRSKKFGVKVTTSDVAREALTKYADEEAA
jgi:predicted transcriptional regulator